MHHANTLAGLACLGALALGCGSSADEASAPAGPATTPASTNACHIDSGHAGDEFCIVAPDAKVGMQLHYGPASYSDKASVEDFMLQPGQETVDCVYFDAPNDSERFFQEFHVSMRAGSHHLITKALAERVEPGHRACENAAKTGQALIGGSQQQVRDVPEGNLVAPENAGLAVKLPAHPQIEMQLHYINTGDKPLLREAWMNVIYKDPATVTTIAGPIAMVGGLGMDIPAGTKQIVHGASTAPKDLRVIDFFGHYHAHTTRFSAWKVVDGEKTLVYESYDWHEPGDVSFDSVHATPAPDPTLRRAGGPAGILEFKKGDGIEWECEIDNTTKQNLKFANEVYTAEMCILFGSYSPSTEQGWVALQQ